MIVFSLRCATGHEFEGWFRDGAAWEKQAKAGKIACPNCGSAKVEKAPMAPRLARQGRAPEISPAEMRKALVAIRKQVEAHCEHVGPNFAEEARKIHYGEVERRNIYGDATDQDAAALREEGVEFARIPWVRRADS